MAGKQMTSLALPERIALTSGDATFVYSLEVVRTSEAGTAEPPLSVHSRNSRTSRNSQSTSREDTRPEIRPNNYEVVTELDQLNVVRQVESEEKTGYLEQPPLSRRSEAQSTARTQSTHGNDFSAVRSSSAVEYDNQSILRSKGNNCCFVLHKDYHHKEFGSAWSLKATSQVALGRGYIVLYTDGSVNWWDIPDALDERLRQKGPALKYVVLGSDGAFFAKFQDSRMLWCGSESFNTALRTGLKQRSVLVDKVAMGANGSWMIMWSDKIIEYDNVPQSMVDVLHASDFKSESVKNFSLGPANEWFIIFEDHSLKASNLPGSLQRSLHEIDTNEGRVREIVFGENESWYVRYWGVGIGG